MIKETKNTLLIAFQLWCQWNIKKMTSEEFKQEYGMSPMEFRRSYWKNGLQKYWIENHTSLRS